MTKTAPASAAQTAADPKKSSTPKPRKAKVKTEAVDQKRKTAEFSSSPPSKIARNTTAAWPATKVDLVPIKDLVPYARNARLHSQSQVLGIANSMLKFGWTNSVLRDEENKIIAGHGRILGAEVNLNRGHREYEFAPVITAVGWTEAQKRAYAIADNQLALNAGWDAKLLESELKAVAGLGFDMNLLGFSRSDLQRALGHTLNGASDPDEAPPPPIKPVSQPGDLWILGKHRVLCGDATSEADVERLYAGSKPVLMVTDPPYGVNYDPTWRDTVGGQFGDGKTKMRGKVSNDDRKDWTPAWKLFPGNVAYIWHASYFIADVQRSIEAVGFHVRSQIIWRKPHFIIGRGDYHWQHEPCWYAVRKGERANWRGGRKQSTMWDIAGLNPAGGTHEAHDGKTSHGTQKPVECMRRPIENNSDIGDIVYDPFLGSGSTLIAAHELERVCYGLELNPAYVDIIVTRWTKFTGGTAILSGRELSFEEIASERKHGRARTKTTTNKPAGADRSNGRRKADPAKRTKAAKRAKAAAA